MNGRGAFSITTALLTIGMIAAAAVVAWFIVSATRSITGQPLLSIVGTPAVSGGKLYFTIRNDGSGRANLSAVTVVISGTSYAATCTPSAISRGQTSMCIADVSSASLTPGSSGNAIVRTVHGDIQISFDVLP